MRETTFAEAARKVTAPGYQPVPFDEDLTLFQEIGRALDEARAGMPAEQFAVFCRANEWIGGTAAEITRFLDQLRESEEDA